jgi:hypothetical protein
MRVKHTGSTELGDRGRLISTQTPIEERADGFDAGSVMSRIGAAS